MKLILFDIDGTLLHSDGAGVKATLDALRDFFGVADQPPGYSMAGKVDSQIVLEILAHANADLSDVRDRLDAYWVAYADRLAEELPRHNVRALPGVSALLAALADRDDVVVGLLTGNLASAADLKLSAAGIDPAQFRLGAYGHEAEVREGLPPLAVLRAREATGRTFTGKHIVIIGDTPADITCGEALGVRTVGVATGRYAVGELRAAGADAVFDDLSDTAAVLSAIVSEA
ncbi:MAG: haloacid dehalogenase-like hydrolase [Anaerolineae bacterium]|nr:haloacid dehalogenase-like hydrolase [Anaerolineae bacterium]